MTIEQLAALPGVALVCKGEAADIDAAYTSDLLSDVMGNAPSDSLLITVQAHRNTVAVATLAGVRAVLVCNNRDVAADMLEAAEEEEIAILRTSMNQFQASVAVGQLLCIGTD